MLNAKAFGLAGGIIWGAVMAVTTILFLLIGYDGALLSIFVEIYPGYSMSWLGVVVGAVYGFVDAGIGCWLFALIYNKFAKK
ncbi:hypothetical protein KY319_01930 [Candidatus Woesearchaeota archaeon]|nr:hypothetical protein [Candidatus Woesearchaeota archaeon]